MTRPTLRNLRERIRIQRYREPDMPREAHGSPMPTPYLIWLVAGHPSPAWYVKSGALGAAAISDALQRQGVAMESLATILDFGVGCGRVARHWKSLPARVHGCDVNPKLIAWCTRNLEWATFATNDIEPPLPYAGDSFDLVYGLSVLTHAPAQLQLPWRDELHRVTKPGGFVVLSLHGDHYRSQLADDERARYDAGELVVKAIGAPGSNAFGAYHPPAYVASAFAERFDVVEHLAEGALGNPRQDLVVLRKRGPGRTPE